ncbi:hypothetical protein [Sphingopyxis panaciterrulae]|uniref:Phosphatidylserine decarboxylase n=1 Tax=Sphingopyxis panaciterrulae TaxID=462372 RepID=A0A7W9ETK9_9SPHN|nr:hypothetical protein [Sphingopyxis panaciterrulae]MBB5708330.1 phosphatidylserine decarboxylase [Sphingopyxis panaciterrulae]
MDAGAIWGGGFILYILVGAFVLGGLNNGPEPEGLLPGSVTKQQWEAREAKGTKLGMIWVGGLVVLLGAWAIFP